MKSVRATAWALFFSAVVVAMTGCRKSLEGNYRDEGSIYFVEFKPGGKALVKIAGDTREASYVVEGNKVTLTSATGAITLTINQDGSLSGAPPFRTLKKRN
ncbi:MAG TPA: hypothetical protein VFC46_07085 [Humisphaera sp.]|nr:hypothetical protein [Humisphaera sp.]